MLFSLPDDYKTLGVIANQSICVSFQSLRSIRDRGAFSIVTVEVMAVRSQMMQSWEQVVHHLVHFAKPEFITPDFKTWVVAFFNMSVTQPFPKFGSQ